MEERSFMLPTANVGPESAVKVAELERATGELTQEGEALNEAQKARKCIQAGNIDQAQTHAMKSLSIMPTCLGYFAAGTVAYAQGEPECALGYYDEAEELETDFVLLHFNIAHTWLVLNNFERALTSTKRAIEIDPTFRQSKALHQTIELRMGRFTQSIETGLEILKQDTEFYDVWLNLARAYMQVSDADEAMKCCNWLIGRKVADVEAYKIRAALYMHASSWIDANRDLNEAKAKDPNNPDLHIWCAQTWKEMGFIAQAFNDLEYAEKLISPDDHQRKEQIAHWRLECHVAQQESYAAVN